MRYADDSVFGFKSEETARRFLTTLKERLAKLGLTLNAIKSGWSILGHTLDAEAAHASDTREAIRAELMQRSQRHRLPWPRFNRIAARFIPTVRKTHPYPKERFYASPMVWQASRFRV